MPHPDPTQPQDALGRANPRMAPDEVWEKVRDDYTAGMPATECCARNGVGLTSLRNRAAREAWRRTDQPWTPPGPLDPEDEGRELEERVQGDLDHVEYRELSFIADRRMMRAVLRGHAVEAARWRRIRRMMDEDERDLMQEIVEEEALQAAWIIRREGGQTDSVDSVDGVFGAPADPS